MGVVIKDKDPQSDNILVYPVESLSQEDGLIREDIKQEIDQVVYNQKAIPIPAKFDRKSFHTAKWFNGGADGRMTSPDVASGETVEIWQYANDPQYWWKTIFREPGLRRKEHVVHAFGNIEEKGPSFDMSTSYGYMFSTRDKKVIIWTTSSDGEPAALQLNMDAGNGIVKLMNDQGNELGFDTRANSTWMKTGEASITISGSNVAVKGILTVNGRPVLTA